VDLEADLGDPPGMESNRDKKEIEMDGKTWDELVELAKREDEIGKAARVRIGEVLNRYEANRLGE
jgi:hypothetical protein